MQNVIFGPNFGTCRAVRSRTSSSTLNAGVVCPSGKRRAMSSPASCRACKRLAHVESMELRPNYLESLKKAGLAPSGKRLYLNLGARGFKDKSTTFFEKYPDASRFEHHAFEATPASMWRETMGWAAAAASGPAPRAAAGCEVDCARNPGDDTKLIVAIKKVAGRAVDGLRRPII